ncbi:MAG: acyl carrier protein [Fibrobacter sp.]|jgi:acyl carrier protein|nr:acyl carrier protein [Fibrobacter sp.]
MTETKVKKILVDVLQVEVEDVTIESNLVDDLAAESIDFVDIMYNIEQEFGIKINPGDIFPTFLREVQIFNDDNKMKDEVRNRLIKDYSHFDNNTLEMFQSTKNPNVFFTVKGIVNFIEKKIAG